MYYLTCPIAKVKYLFDKNKTSSLKQDLFYVMLYLKTTLKENAFKVYSQLKTYSIGRRSDPFFSQLILRLLSVVSPIFKIGLKA
jgi:hypothetical protein